MNKENLLPLYCMAKPAIIIDHQFRARAGIVSENGLAFGSDFGAELNRVAFSLSRNIDTI
jgi:hypothetical protein